MGANNIVNKITSGVNNGVSKLKKGAIILATTGVLTGALQSCNNDNVGYGKGTKTEQVETKGLRDSFNKEYNTFWQSKFVGEKHKISQGPILVTRGENYSILISIDNSVGGKTISKLYDNGDVGFSYNYDGLGSLISGKNTIDGLQTISTTSEYDEVYKKLIEIFKQANGK